MEHMGTIQLVRTGGLGTRRVHGQAVRKHCFFKSLVEHKETVDPRRQKGKLQCGSVSTRQKRGAPFGAPLVMGQLADVDVDDLAGDGLLVGAVVEVVHDGGADVAAAVDADDAGF